MLEFLQRHLVAKKAGTAGIMYRTVGSKGDALRAMLWSVDAVGMVITRENQPDYHIALPWNTVSVVFIER